MVWAVVDTNQAGLLPPLSGLLVGGHAVEGLTLPPYVLAEIILHRRSGKVLRRVAQYRLRVGLHPPDVWEHVVRLPLSEIPTLEPFPVASATYREDYRDLLAPFTAVTNRHRRWAEKVKQKHRQFCRGFQMQAMRLRRDMEMRLTPAARSEARITDVDDALRKHGDGPGSFLHHLATLGLQGSDGMRILPDEAERVDAMLENPYLGRYFRGWWIYLLSISRLWVDQRLNFDPTGSRDDVTDLTLPLYAGQADALVTADRVLIRIATQADRHGGLVICPAQAGQPPRVP